MQNLNRLYCPDCGNEVYPASEGCKHCQEYEVYGTKDGCGECIGTVTMPKDASYQDIPEEIIINGIVYYPQF